MTKRDWDGVEHHEHDAAQRIADHTQDLYTASAIGAVSAQIAIMMTRQEAMDKKLDNVVATMNRWKGGAAILIFLGTFVGAMGSWLLKVSGKA